MQAAIDVQGLSKRFHSHSAVDDVSFQVLAGQLTGFVGPNGAGKSTTMKMILGLDTPDSGVALVQGMPYRALRRPMTVVGALLDAGAIHPARSLRNHLLWMARSQGLSVRRVDEIIELSGLDSVARRRAGALSLGMRQRLGIAGAMIGDPGIVILDEPFNGMDPEGIVWMRGYLRGLAAEGRAVLVSTHLMSELQDTATHLVVLGRGRLVTDKSVAELVAAASNGRVNVRTVSMTEATRALASAGATVIASERGQLTVTGLEAERIVSVLTAADITFSEVSAHEASLEEAYMELTRDQVEFRATNPERRAS
jgi:ABC-2 type transport system ATP-binding protein